MGKRIHEDTQRDTKDVGQAISLSIMDRQDCLSYVNNVWDGY